MSCKREILCCSLLVCIVLLVGCETVQSLNPAKLLGGGKASDEIKKTPDEVKKEKLLKKIDRKFENPTVHYELGRMYQADGLWIQAEREFNIALGFDPVHREAQGAMVKVLGDAGEAARAALAAEFYMNQASISAMGSLRLGLAFQKHRLDDYAMDCYRQALHLAPNSAKINRQIGFYHLSKGNKIQAKDYLARSFQLNNNQPEVAGELGRLGVQIKRPTKIQKDTSRLDKTVDRSTAIE